MSVQFRAAGSREKAHTDSVWTVSWSAAGRLITGSVDETVKVWCVDGARTGCSSVFDAECREDGDSLPHAQSLEGHQLGVVSVSASRCGKCASWGLEARAWPSTEKINAGITVSRRGNFGDGQLRARV